MKKILQLTLVSSLAIGLNIPSGLFAETSQVANMPQTVNTDSPEIAGFPTHDIHKAKFLKVRSGYDEDHYDRDNVNFTFQHHLKLGDSNIKLPKEWVAITLKQMENNQLALLEVFKQALTQLDMLDRPLQAHTVFELLLPRDIARELGKIPVLLLITNIDADGVGKSDLVWFPFHKEISAGYQTESRLDIDGLKGQLMFTKNLDTLTTQLRFLDITLNEENILLSWEGMTFDGTLKADLSPLKLVFVLPKFKGQLKRDSLEWDLQSLLFNWNVEKTSTGVELVEVNTTVGHFELQLAESKLSLDNLAIKNDVEETEELFVNENVQVSVEKLLLPASMTLGEELEVSYTSTLALRHLDAKIWQTLQTTIPELHKEYNKLESTPYYYDRSSIQEKVFEPLMAILLQLLVKSPEIELTQLNVETSKGNLHGSANVTLDGTQITSLKYRLEDMLALIPALQVRAQFSIDKTLLEQGIVMLTGSPEQAKIFREQEFLTLVANKWLVETDNRYTFAMVFKNSQLVLNGQEVSLSSFLKMDNHSSPDEEDDESSPLLGKEVHPSFKDEEKSPLLEKN